MTATLAALRNSPATAKQKVKFILATDGKTLESESLAEDSETVACDYPKFPDHFGFFLPLAGITTVKQIRENAFDIRAMNTKLAERAAEKIKPWANGFLIAEYQCDVHYRGESLALAEFLPLEKANYSGKPYARRHLQAVHQECRAMERDARIRRFRQTERQGSLFSRS